MPAQSKLYTHARRPVVSRLARMAAVFALCCVITPLAFAQSFPTQSVRWVVPFPPGGGLDAVARMLSPAMQQSLGQTVIVENKAGGSGFIGTLTMTKAKPDGHTLMIQALGMSMNPSIYNGLPYDAIKDVQPVAQIGVVPVILAVGKHVKANTLQEFIAAAKAAPGKFKGAAFVPGSSVVMLEMFKLQAGVDIQIVTYRGVGPALQALSGGEGDLVIMDGASLVSQIQSGRVKGLAVAGDQRIAEIPDVPTTQQAGLPKYKIEFWYGAFTTGGTPPAVVERLNAEINKASASPEVAKRLRGLGLTPVQRSAADFTRQHHAEMKEWAEVVRLSGFKQLQVK